jgi:hypothetical protein
MMISPIHGVLYSMESFLGQLDVRSFEEPENFFTPVQQRS